MAITIRTQPTVISPIYGDMIVEFKETSISNYTLAHYSVKVDIIGGGDMEYKVHPDVTGYGKLDIRYILENFIESQFASITATGSIPLLRYNLILKTYNNDILLNTSNISNLSTYSGTSQEYNAFNISDFVNHNRLMNSTQNFYINRGDDLTIQVMDLSGSDVSEITVTKSDGTNHLITITPGSPRILSIDISQDALGISNSDNYYKVEVGSSVSNVYVKDADTRYIPQRFRFINENGATDYVNFNLAKTESSKVKRNTYNNDGRMVIYSTEVTPSFTVLSDYMTEEASIGLRNFWVTPKVEVLRNNIWTPIILNNTSSKVLFRKRGLINYEVNYSFISNFNIQKH